MNARLAGCAIALLLAGCAIAPSTQPLPALSAIPAAFELSGRISVRQGERSDIARLRWSHRASADVWVISSPLGNEVARIESDGDGARLAQAGATPVAAPSFADLTESLLGVALEPRLLAAWLHGAAADGAPSDWSVVIDEKQPAGAITIARRISASRGDVTVRLVVDDYRALGE
jgi:outer membrane lipoprotein LolB